MNHHRYKEFCYLWSLNAPYTAFPCFLPSPPWSHQEPDLFLLHLELLLLNLRNSLRPNTDASPRPWDKGRCLKLLLIQPPLENPPCAWSPRRGGENPLSSINWYLSRSHFILQNTQHTGQDAEDCVIFRFGQLPLRCRSFRYPHHHLALVKGFLG